MKARLGGLARRATYIQKLRDTGTPFLHLEAGDAFQTKYDVSEAERPRVEDAAAVYLDVFALMGLQAYNIGDRDLALGLPLLRKLAKEAKFPFLSANLLDADGKPIFAPSVVLEVAGHKVAVIGVLTTLFVNRAQFTAANSVTLEAPDQAVAREVARHKAAGVELFAVLAHLNDTEIEALARANPDVDFILGGQSTKMQRTLLHVEGAWVANAYQRGKNISVLAAHVNGGSLTFVDRNRKSALAGRKLELERQVANRERSLEAARNNPQRASSVDYLERNLVQLRAELQQVELDLEDVPTPDPNASYLAWVLEGMTTDFIDHAAVAARVAEHRKVYPDPTKPRTPAARPPARGAAPPARGAPPTVRGAAPPARGAAPTARGAAPTRSRVAPPSRRVAPPSRTATPPQRRP